MTEQLKELEKLARKELETVDVYKHSISFNFIEKVRNYFSHKKDLNVKIESSSTITLQDLSNKYTAIFERN